MYLIIFDRNCLEEDREYYLCKGEYLDRILTIFPKLRDLQCDDIEEILICSMARKDFQISAKVCKCSGLRIKDKILKIDYTQIQQITEKCEQIRKRVYATLIHRGEIKSKDGLPFVVVIDNYQSYLNIKENTNAVKFKSFMEIISDLKLKRQWKEIVDKFPLSDQIEVSELWHNVYCLKELAYALAKITEPGNKKMNHQEKSIYEKYFFKVIERCIELAPNKSTHKSMLAYHYYLVFMNSKNNRDGCYDKAIGLYQEILKNSPENYKELYRYTKLRQINFKNTKWQSTELWIQHINEIVRDFEKLIKDFETFSEDKQKKCKKEYVGALFGFASFNIDNLLKYYETYTNNKIFGKPIKEALFKKERLETIPQIEGFLNKIIQMRGYNKENANIDLGTKPSYLDIYYRLAELEQIKGLVYVLKGEKKEKYLTYFKQSNVYVKKVLDIALEKRRLNFKFLFPYFIKVTQAINYHFLNEIEECHKCFYKAKPYMIYEQGILYCLQGNMKLVTEVLKSIPANDNCHNKAQILIERIQNGDE